MGDFTGYQDPPTTGWHRGDARAIVAEQEILSSLWELDPGEYFSQLPREYFEGLRTFESVDH
tara:strand:+ start:8784 stop:8969 length:186 start_codon:yes stop_codon:yes gene_type:complete